MAHGERNVGTKMRHELAKIKDLFHKLNYVLSKQQKQYGVMVFLCTLLSAGLETLGVSAIMPVVEGLTDVDGLREKWYLQPFINTFHIENASTLIYIVCAGVIVVYFSKNIYFIFYTWLVKKYTYKIKRELGMRVMESYMAQGYIFFVNHNSSRLLQGLSGDINAVNSIISSIFSLSTKLLTIGAIGIFILLKEPVMAISLLILSVICVVAVQLTYKNSMKKYGEQQREASWNNNQACLEMIHGSKEVLVTGRQEYFKRRYVQSINEHNRCSIKIEMATTVPAYIIETVCIIGLLLAVVVQVGSRGITTDMIASLSAIGIAAFRILPAVGSVSSVMNAIRSSIPSFNASYETIKRVNELEDEIAQRKEQGLLEEHEDIRFGRELQINHIYYKYPATDKYILEDVCLKIKAKSSIGLIGTSGAGKSTFVDVLLGLLEPESGEILMDGKDTALMGKVWNRNIGYVPQNIYLVDDDIRGNIAFGIDKDKIDDKQVWRALEMAQLSDFVKGQPKGLNTKVGEWGVKFSGGQRQRVAIARALYTNPEILVLDEATAALDNETESALMEAIEALLGHKTLIVVAHRLTTIRRCDYIYEVKDGKMFERSKREVFGE